MKRKLINFITALLFLIMQSIYADNLIQVYYQAVEKDPTFLEAHASWLSAQQDLPIAISGSGAPGSSLLPYVTITGSLAQTHQKIAVDFTPNSGDNGDRASEYFKKNTYLVTLTQPIFNYATWKSISRAHFTVKAATARYIADTQDLILRTAQAYFNVLNAYDQLQFTLAQKKSFLHQLITAEEKFKVGLIAITGVYDAQASYDQAVAQEIQDRNNLANQLENLRAITGREYKSLAGLKNTIPLLIPHPSNINAWTIIAERQSYSIQSVLYSMLAQQELVKQTAAGWYPTLTGVITHESNQQGFPSTLSELPATTGANFINKTGTTTSGGVNLNFPIFQGGYVIHATQKEEYNYLSASQQLNLTHRQVVQQTRQAYLGVDSGISKIKADEQAIVSAENKLKATQAGYVVGTRTMVNVLDAVTNLYQAQQQWASDRYMYIINIITLKQQAGTLCPQDLLEINSWLGKSVKFDLNKPVIVSKYATELPTALSKNN
ncbi:Type I secretion outer membrane protein, TolC precursor [Coxiella-like endosymbiont]|uniref:TolC family outer membrane protein n=1 Tax=Coxiella-like endosymbiont TaxID=1592897 RepID=UPI000C80D601|nr:TolC family outer membrane protein [Coxiella-like endosymbiont]PMB54940.1 Type I secretion outer membrane protein, TolC precursor [Coxiella-like endosymbiont]